MSMREDKTSNILKNYTNLVNRLKQSQRERNEQSTEQPIPAPGGEEMPFAMELSNGNQQQDV